MSQNSSRKKPRIRVYTAITGEKDKLRTDIKCYGSYRKFKRPVMNAKIYKVLPHLFFKADYSLWIDGNVEMLVKPESLLHYLDDADMAVFKGYEPHDCIYMEGDDCKMLDSVNEQDRRIIDWQMARLRKEGYPEHNGMFACTVLLRKHTKKTEEFNNMWWAEICRGSHRDQLSAQYVVHKSGLRLNYMKGSIIDNDYFRLRPHKKNI